MEAVPVRDAGGFELVDPPVTRSRSGEALIEVTVTRLHRTDLKPIRMGHRDLELPRVPGEEVVGVIREMRIAGFHRDGGLAGHVPAPTSRPTSTISTAAGRPSFGVCGCAFRHGRGAGGGRGCGVTRTAAGGARGSRFAYPSRKGRG